MNFVDTDKKIGFLINFFYYLCLILITFFLFKTASGYLLPFVFGFALAYTARKLGQRISRKRKIEKNTAIYSYFALFIIFLSIFVLIISVFKIILPLIKSEIPEIGKYIKTGYGGIKKGLSGLSKNSETYNRLIEYSESLIKNVVSYLSSATAKAVSGLPSFLISLLVAVTSSVYFLKYYDNLARFLFNLINPKRYKIITDIKNIAVDTVVKFFTGYLKLFLLTAFELTVGFLIIRVPNPIILSLLISVVDIFPILGVGTVLIPWGIFSFFQGKELFGTGIIIIYIIISVVRNFAEPHILGKGFDINPLFALAGIFLGFKIGGIGGILLFPVSAVICINYFKSQN